MVRKWFTASVLLAMLLVCPRAFGATGSNVTIPAPTAKRPGPIKLTYDFNWVDGNGYRPVRVTAASISGQPVVGEQAIEITMYPGASHPTRELFGVTGQIVIPDGAVSGSGWLYIPQSKPWLHGVRVHANVNGRTNKALSSQFSFDTDYNWTEAQPSFLFIDSAAPSTASRETTVRVWKTGQRSDEKTYTLPNVSRLASVYVNAVIPGGGGAVDDEQILAFVEDNDRVELRRPNDIPDEWIGYSCLSVVYISAVEAQKIAKTEQWGAIQEWVAAGGVLCVFDVGEEFQQLAAVEKLLELQPLRNSKNKFRGWTTPTQAAKESKVIGPKVNEYYTRDYGIYEADDVDEPQAVESKPQPTVLIADPSQVEFVTRPCQLGMVVAIRTDKPMDMHPANLSAMVNSVGYNQLMWRNRQGFSLSNMNNQFWEFLLPGVGGAPVILFLILITLFVLVIGPINYLLLKKFKRLYLILISVPLGAAVVTLSLFFFALLTDGIQTRVRVRSFTDLDQTRGHAASMSRQTYYAGIAPGGLSFPKHATVYPIEYQPQGYINDTKPKQITWGADEQLFQRGFIASRNWSQFMVTQSQASERNIEFKPGSGGDPSLVNNLEANIQAIILADENGKLWFARDIRNGNTQTMEAANLQNVRSELKELVRANNPAAPRNFDPSQANSMTDNWYYYNNEIDGEYGDPRMRTSLLEGGIGDLANPGGLRPRMYYAIVDHSADVAVGVGWPSLEAGFEVIRGRW